VKAGTEITNILIQTRNLRKYFPIKAGLLGRAGTFVRAIDDVSFSMNAGETLGLVGESGCGKTTLGRVILRLIEPDSGEMYYEGRNLLELSREEMRKMRGEMQIVFQDPYSSLNPRMTIKNIVGEPFIVHQSMSRSDVRERVLELLRIVGLDEQHLNRYPHEFSGGQRQRIAIARALALKPKLIVLDEPTSSLDVSVQAQMLNMLMDLQKWLSLTYLFISHNLSVVKHISSRIAVMYVGKIVEIADSKELFHNPLHPYAEALLSAILTPDAGARKERIILTGEVPSPSEPPSGCRFHPRCAYRMSKCAEAEPSIEDVDDGHYVACFLRSGSAASETAA